VQGEYFRRKEDGLLTYDTTGANLTGSYAVTQSGWYLQSVYQFMPTWRTGLRYDWLRSRNSGCRLIYRGRCHQQLRILSCAHHMDDGLQPQRILTHSACNWRTTTRGKAWRKTRCSCNTS